MVNMTFIIQVRKHSMVHNKMISIKIILVHFVLGGLGITYGIALRAQQQNESLATPEIIQQLSLS